MKTIEERAKEACKEWAGGELDDDIQDGCFMDGFVVGAMSEREELARWHDPKVELPDEYIPVLVKYGHIETRKAVVWLMVTPTGRRVWNVDNSDMVILDKDIIGWRHIHEN